MKIKQRWRNVLKIGVPVLLIAATLLTGTALAQAGLTLDRYIIAGGGGHSQGGDGRYILDATLGQAIVGSGSGGDGQFTLGGGYWNEPLLRKNLPLVLRQS
jgi:hypothetical protein